MKLDAIKAALPKRPKNFRATPEFQTPEEATCWGIAARMRQSYLFSKYSNEDHNLRHLAFGLPIRVYVLGFALKRRARFSEWFAKASDSRYRIVISTSPESYAQRKFYHPSIGPHASDHPRLIEPIKAHLSGLERRVGKAFLIEFAEATWFGQVAVDHLLEEAGHAYWSSDGMPMDSDK